MTADELEKWTQWIERRVARLERVLTPWIVIAPPDPATPLERNMPDFRKEIEAYLDTNPPKILVPRKIQITPSRPHQWQSVESGRQKMRVCIVCLAYDHDYIVNQPCPGKPNTEGDLVWETIHLAETPFKPACGMDYPGLRTSISPSEATCTICRFYLSHNWSREPVMSDRRVCLDCGVYDLWTRMPPCPGPSKKMEPCCECGKDYPQTDLFAGHIFCPKCREKESNRGRTT